MAQHDPVDRAEDWLDDHTQPEATARRASTPTARPTWPTSDGSSRTR